MLLVLGDRQQRGSSSGKSRGAESAGSAPPISREPSSWRSPPGRWHSRVKKCWSQDCTIQHCSKVKEWEETGTKWETLSAKVGVFVPGPAVHGMWCPGKPSLHVPSHQLPWKVPLGHYKASALLTLPPALAGRSRAAEDWKGGQGATPRWWHKDSGSEPQSKSVPRYCRGVAGLWGKQRN